MSITWLHISDLHRGQPGDTRWSVSKQVLLDDMKEHIAEIGPPDLMLFSGDLAYAGSENDYRSVDETLEDIYECIGQDVILVSVPGNHDLVRPHKYELAALACKQYFADPAVRGGICDAHKTTLTFLGSLFANYSAWWERSVLRQWKARGLKYTTGLLPGDFVVTLEKEDLRLGIAGMNSAFLHFGDMDEGALAIEYEQLGRVKDLGRWREEHDAALLLMHHPRQWLNKISQRVLLDSIYPGNSFTGCCFGHMHENEAETVTSGGSDTRRWLQAASLFGLERYGKADETRSVGYAWGRLERLDARTGVLTRWPRVARRSEGGSLRIFDGDIKPYPHRENVPLSERRPQRACRVSVIAVPSEFPFVEPSLVRRIEELRSGLVCELISAEDDVPKTDTSELGVVLVGGLTGKHTVLADAIQRTENLVVHSNSLESKHVVRSDWDPKGLAALVSQRADSGKFTFEDDILGQVRVALDKVCKPESVLIPDQSDDPFRSYVLADLEVRRKDAHAAFAAGDFERALSGYNDLAYRAEELRTRNQTTDEVNKAWARSRLNVAACHLALGDTDHAREIVISMEAELLSNDARAVLAKALVNVREMEMAERIASTLHAEAFERVKQLIAVSLGQVPTSKPAEGDQLIYAAQLLIREERFHTALDWILSALPLLENEVLGKLAALETMMALLEGWAWAEEWSDALSKDDAEILLVNLEALLADLKARKLATAHAQRVSEIEYGFAIRMGDQDRVERVRSSLARLGGLSPRVNAAFDEALALGRGGDVAAALAAAAEDEHPWRGRLRQIGILTLLGDHAAALDASLRLVEEFPNRLTTEHEAAEHLVRAERIVEALSHAQFAFAAAPGYGSRLLLAGILLRLKRHQECVDLAKPLADIGDRNALMLYAQGMEQIDPKEAIRTWREYDSMVGDLQVKLRIVDLELRTGRAAEAAEHAWSIVEREDARELSASILYQLALMQTFGSPANAHERVTQIARLLKQRATSTSEEALYLQLWSWLQAPKQLPPPDFSRLVESGAIVPVPEPELNKAIEGSAALVSNVWEAYQLGHLPFEAVHAELSLNSARYVLSLGTEGYLPANSVSEPDAAESTPDVRRLLVSELELLLCQKLGMLNRLESALTTPPEILIFEDVRNRFLQMIALMRLSQPEKRLQESQRVTSAIMNSEFVRVVGALADDMPVVGETVQISEMVAWLQEAGAISRTRAQALVPALVSSAGWSPGHGLAVTAAALRWLVVNDMLETVVRAVSAPLLLSAANRENLRLDHEDATREVEALTLGAQVHAWLEARLEMGIAKIISRPTVELSAAKAPPFEKMRNWVAMALSWRVAAHEHDAHCLSVDTCVRDLFSGIYLPQILHAIKWSRETYLATKDRFRSLGSRLLGMRWLASALKLNVIEREQVAVCGAVDVLDAPTLLGLLDEYEPGAAAIDRILDIVEVPLKEPRHAKSIGAQLLVGRPYAAVVKLLLDRAGNTAADFASHVLNRWDAYAGRPAGGFLAFVFPAVFDRPAAAYTESSPGKYFPSNSSSVGRLFGAIIEWAKSDQNRLALLGGAAADIVVLIDKAAGDEGPAEIVLGVLQLLVRLMPGGDSADLTNELLGALAIVGGVWMKTPLQTMGFSAQLVEGSETQVTNLIFEDLLREGVARLGTAEGPKLDPLFATWRKEILSDHIVVRVPVEAVVLRAMPEVAAQLARRLASLQGPNDGTMYLMLQQFAENPSDPMARKRLARRSIQSPWKQMLRDPSTLLWWGRAEGIYTGLPVNLEAVLQLFSEPLDLDHAPKALKRLELYLDGVWKERSDKRELFLLAANVPGEAGVQVAGALAEDPQLKDAVTMLRSPEGVSAADLWTSLTALWIAAAEDRQLKIGDETRPARIELQGCVGALLTSIIGDPERGKLEVQLLRQCRGVIAMLHPSAYNLVWLTYRLFGWIWDQIRSLNAEEVRTQLLQLTSWSGNIAYGDSEPRDPMDPSIWSDTPDLRLAAVMNVLALYDGLPSGDAKDRWWISVSGDLRDQLIRIASKEIVNVDRQLRNFSDSDWQWIGTAMPQENALFLLLRDHSNFPSLELSVRLRWLQELPTGTPGQGIREEALISRLLINAAASMEVLTDLERATLAKRLLESTSPYLHAGTGQAMVLVALQASGLTTSETVWPRIKPLVSADGPGAGIARFFVEALVKAEAEDLVARLQDLMDAVRGTSSIELIERIQMDPIFEGSPELVDSIREFLRRRSP